MKKKMLVCGLIPALTLGICNTSFAEEATVDDIAPATATEKSIEELRLQLEEQLKSAQELQERLNAQLESLDKRVSKVEKHRWQPPIELHGYSRLRWDNRKYEGYDNPIDNKTIWLNLNTEYKINDNLSIKAEDEFVDNLTQNTGAYQGDAGYGYTNGGKQWSREALQLYANGKIGEVEFKAGRFYHQSPYKFTFDEKINGVELKWGTQFTKWGRSTFTLDAGNIYSKMFYGDTDVPNDGTTKYSGRWGEGGDHRFKMVGLTAEVPIAKNTNLVGTYGKITHRNNSSLSRKVYSLGFDTKLCRDVKLIAAMAQSDSSTLNRSYVAELRYKEANQYVPGTYDFYIKKYLQRGHTGMTNWFNDDIEAPTDHSQQLGDENGGFNWDHRAGEFNGIRIGADYVPAKNTKLELSYTFGAFGLFDPGTGNLTGKKMNHNFFRAQMNFYF